MNILKQIPIYVFYYVIHKIAPAKAHDVAPPLATEPAPQH